MQSCHISNIGYPGFFKSTTKENNHLKFNRTFNLQVNQRVSLHTFQCLDCNTIITLTCENNLQKVVNVSSSQGSKLVSVHLSVIKI
jgi:Fe2+ or Zn2+ uptake regulation protein